jgi:hypothetical protein
MAAPTAPTATAAAGPRARRSHEVPRRRRGVLIAALAPLLVVGCVAPGVSDEPEASETPEIGRSTSAIASAAVFDGHSIGGAWILKVIDAEADDIRDARHLVARLHRQLSDGSLRPDG